MDSSRKIAAEMIGASGSFWVAAARPSGRGCAGSRYRLRRCCARLWPDAADRCICLRTHFGRHFNPAVTFGLYVAGRFPAKDDAVYWVAQLLGGIQPALHLLRHRKRWGRLRRSRRLRDQRLRRSLPAALFAAGRTDLRDRDDFMFLIVNWNTTSQGSRRGFAPLAIGLALTLIHLISIPVTNTSVNPARSTAVRHISGRLGGRATLAVLGRAPDRGWTSRPCPALGSRPNRP